MSIILIRHGETALNAARIIQPADTPLSVHGIEQARLMAPRVSALNIAGILCSDLPRAAMTAEPLAAVTGLTVKFSPLLQERNFGDLRGKAYDSLGFDPVSTPEGPPNGESEAQFRDRVARAFEQALAMRRPLDGPLAVVTHGLVVRLMLSLHCELAGAVVPERILNTSLSIFDAEPPYRVTLMNSESHLDLRHRDDGKSLAGM